MNTVFKALADPTRRKVLQLLRNKPMSAGELCDHFPVSRPTMSAHFAVLREANLIEAQKIGTTIMYQIKLSVLEDALLGFARMFGIRADAASSATAADDVKPAPGKKAPKGKAK